MPKRSLRADDLLSYVFVGDPQISPDGKHILFSHKTITEKNKYLTHLYTVDLGSYVKRWTQGEVSASSGRWSPDGKLIAFISGREKPASQIFLMPFDGGEAAKLTKLPEGSIGEMRWSPDGHFIAFTFRDELPDRTEAAKKEQTEKGLSTPPLITEDIWYRLDGDGYFGMQRYKLYVVDVRTGDHRIVCEASPNGDYSFDWAPNSLELAVIHSAAKRTSVEPPNDQIWRIRLDGTITKLAGLPGGVKSSIRWSPDGQTLAYAGDVDEKDPWGTRNTKIYVVFAEGGAPKCLTDHLDYDMGVATLSDCKEGGPDAPLEWTPNSEALYVQVGWQGESQVARVNLDGSFAMLTEGKHFIGLGNVCHDGKRISILYGNPTALPEIGVLHVGSEDDLDRDILTNFNGAYHAEVELSVPEELWLDSTDGVKVHGWILKPTGFDEGNQYPAVLEIHGGPHTQYGWTFFHEFQLLAAEGYVVVYANPRGSKGYGEKFCSAIQGDWGNKDWEDMQTAIRLMKEQPFIQLDRMGVMGGSYGGYMTNWIIDHTKDFRAAITDRCVSNMVSMSGNSDFPFNKEGYFKGVAWSNHDEIKALWHQSPIAYFDQVTTPTLIIHSEGDLRCNIEQSEEVFSALQQQGIESRFVRYPVTTSHGMSRNGPPDLRLHRLGEIVTWWNRFLK